MYSLAHLSKYFIPRQRDDAPFNRAGRAIKKSAIVCVGLAVNLGFYPVGACLRLNNKKSDNRLEILAMK